MWTFWLASWATGARPVPADPPIRALADGLRMLIVDGRLPVGAQSAQRAGAGRRPAGLAHHRHRRLHPDA